MKSMTGFGRATFESGGRRVRVELRTVNSRFLDMKLRLPFNDAELEHEAAVLVKQALSRGRVDLSVLDEGGGTGQGTLQLEQRVADDLVRALDLLADRLGGNRTLAAQLMPVPRDLLVQRSETAEDVRPAFLAALEQALVALTAMRQREGMGLRRDLEQHLAHLEDLATSIAARTKDEPRLLRERLEQRLQQLSSVKEIDPARLAQEAAIVAERCDVSEELARLRIHSEQLRQMLAADEPMGRQLEFMLQELLRELNTIASKTSDAEAGSLVVEAKGTLEKMREQAQNVE